MWLGLDCRRAVWERSHLDQYDCIRIDIMVMKETTLSKIAVERRGTTAKTTMTSRKVFATCGPTRDQLILITGSLFSVLPDRMDRRSSFLFRGVVGSSFSNTRPLSSKRSCYIFNFVISKTDQHILKHRLDMRVIFFASLII